MKAGAVRSYRDLLVWQRGIELAKNVYALTQGFPKTERFALANQMQRSAVSVPSNIAEGQARQHTKEFRQFLYVALGSLAELDTLFTLAVELGYVDREAFDRRQQDIVILKKMIRSLLSKLGLRKAK